MFCHPSPVRLGVAFATAWIAVVTLFCSQPLRLQADEQPADKKLPVLIVDGQNNHNWKQTTPLIQATLEATGLFTIDIATSPAGGQDMASFKPDFSKYKLVVSNYNGDPWNEETQTAFDRFVSSGGGFVAVHAADNSFPKWQAYNRMIGLGGWGGRSEKDGPLVRWNEDSKSFTRDTTPGGGGTHGQRTPFLMVVRDADHPITRGLPKSWLQTKDELYGRLRGPAENMHVLATAFSDKSTGGTGEHEPILMSINYGNGRVFHTTLGHDAEAMQGTAFQVTLQRGAQWAATGDVTLPAVTSEVLSDQSPITRDPMALITAAKTSVNFDNPPDLAAESWTSLFNGQDLNGWSQKNGTAMYRVENGAIIGKTAQGSPNSFLCTDRNYSDFELTFEVMVDAGLNSGVQIRSQSKSDYQNGRVHGPQVEIENSPGEAGYIYSEATGRNWISPEQPIKDAFKNSEWNQYLVRAVGDRYQTWINGRKIEDLSDAESFHEGFIGLQVHGIGANEGPFEVRWRNLKIRELK